MAVISRALGVTTIAVGLVELARPAIWGERTGLGGPSPAMRTWHHTLGVRDVVSGVALIAAPVGPQLHAATWYRILSDLTDAVAFGVNAPGAVGKGKAAGAALGYAAVGALTLRWARR